MIRVVYRYVEMYIIPVAIAAVAKMYVVVTVAAFGFSRLWKKLAKDDGRITYGIIAGASAVATIIVYLLLGKIF